MFSRSFVESVTAGVIAYYICQWLDRLLALYKQLARQHDRIHAKNPLKVCDTYQRVLFVLNVLSFLPNHILTPSIVHCNT